MTASPRDLVRAIQAEFGEPKWEGLRVLVALSGGLDSLVLLHLLRFSPGLRRLDLQAAHFDHRMRKGSNRDALWVRGLCRAWGIPIHLGVSSTPLSSENEAREARYDFLFRVKGREGAERILTAHHGDDQAETVLFRIFRGTGLAGLAGIPSRRPPGLFRPLLPFSREVLQAYARDARIRPRNDPSNLDLGMARNTLRHVILPRVEAGVAPGARSSLRRLARLARENEVAWRSIIPGLLDSMTEAESRGIFLLRDTFLAQHPAVRVRLLRAFLQREGLILDEAGTRRVLEFTKAGASGRGLDLPGGVRFRREFHRYCLEVERNPGQDRSLDLLDPGPGEGSVLLGGRAFSVRWGGSTGIDARLGVDLPLPALDFPLRIRGWLPGDRIAMTYGTKKLKKLLAEAGVPLGERNSIPVLADSAGSILWVAGVATAASVGFIGDQARFSIGIDDTHDS